MPRYFAVRRVRGPAWNWSRPMREQVLWDAHARFMNALAAEGFVVLGGPIGDDGAETLLARLATDPWTHVGLLEIARVEPWTILLDGRSP